jgi:RimJ/RimL family protein N-acetyltransferase
VGPITISTQRLVMRGFTDADRPAFAAINADPVVTEFLQGPQSAERTDDFLRRIDECWNANGWSLWCVEVVGGPACIGYVGLWPADYVEPGMVEVGWRLAADQWGQGYAAEAAREAMRFGFESAGLDEIVSFTVPQNRQSWRVMEKIGLIRDPAGDFDHSEVDPAVHPDLVRHVMYRLRRDQWVARATAPQP